VELGPDGCVDELELDLLQSRLHVLAPSEALLDATDCLLAGASLGNLTGRSLNGWCRSSGRRAFLLTLARVLLMYCVLRGLHLSVRVSAHMHQLLEVVVVLPSCWGLRSAARVHPGGCYIFSCSIPWVLFGLGLL
jgi:hypothetical protein